MRPGQPRLPQRTSGLYYTTPGLEFTAASPTLNRLRVFPFDNHRAAKFDRLASYVTIAAATATLRWVVYADTGNSYPGALLLDTGAVGDASTTGLKETTVDLLLGARRYWLGCLVQGADVTMRLHNSATSPSVGISASDLAFGGNVIGYFVSSITGAAPATFPTVSSGSSLATQVWVRKS